MILHFIKRLITESLSIDFQLQTKYLSVYFFNVFVSASSVDFSFVLLH